MHSSLFLSFCLHIVVLMLIDIHIHIHMTWHCIRNRSFCTKSMLGTIEAYVYTHTDKATESIVYLTAHTHTNIHHFKRQWKCECSVFVCECIHRLTKENLDKIECDLCVSKQRIAEIKLKKFIIDVQKSRHSHTHTDELNFISTS